MVQGAREEIRSREASWSALPRVDPEEEEGFAALDGRAFFVIDL